MRSSDEATAQIWLAVRLFDSYEWLDDETSTLPQACDILPPKQHERSNWEVLQTSKGITVRLRSEISVDAIKRMIHGTGTDLASFHKVIGAPRK